MVDTVRNSAMLWTGGKDSSMALYEAGQSGHCVRCLVTFMPPARNFLAHPLGFIELQARALALPHYVLPVREPFERSYESGLRWLREELGIDCVVTGDIAEVAGYPNWIRDRCRPVGMGVHTPLWGRDRGVLLRQLLDRGFRARISCIDTRRLDVSWLGRELDAAAIDGLQAIRDRSGLDLCGEEGEYHTLVVDGPQFTRGIDTRSCSIREAGSLAYLEIHEMELEQIGSEHNCG